MRMDGWSIDAESHSNPSDKGNPVSSGILMPGNPGGCGKGVFDSLKKDLGLGDIPILLGELLQLRGPAAPVTIHVHELASKPNCKVASSGLLETQ